MRSLIRRYIMNEQRIQERQRGVTEDDCNEIKQDISALRFEMREMLREGLGERLKGDNGQCTVIFTAHLFIVGFFPMQIVHHFSMEVAILAERADNVSDD